MSYSVTTHNVRSVEPSAPRLQMPNPAAMNRGQTAMSAAQSAREMSEVQCRAFLAMSAPRDEMDCLEKILNACRRPGLAEKATYVYKRGGSDINGPSIRLAEAIAQHWRNIDYGFRPLQTYVNEYGTVVTDVQAYAWDLERNTRKEITFSVPHVRSTKTGTYQLSDPRDVYELIANQASRRVRNCILAIIPGDIVDDAVAECTKTLSTKVNLTPERIKQMLEKFKTYGVSKQQIEEKIGRHVDAITPQQFVHLGQIFTSLEDGIGKPSDYFAEEEGEKKEVSNPLEALKEAARGKSKKDTTKKKEDEGNELL